MFRIGLPPGARTTKNGHKIDDTIFTGDALFLEDYGTGRCDFPRGDADQLYTSVHDKLYALPDATRLGNGCTSGHGVCGLSRLSIRSLVATLVFMATGALTVLVERHLLQGGAG